MASPPSSAIAGAAVAAQALAGLLTDLARTLPVPAATAQGARATARRVALQAGRFVSLAQVGAAAAALVTAAQALARDASPADASAGLYAAAAATQACAPTSASPALTQAYTLARALCAGLEAACLGEAFLAEARTSFGDRPAAAAARARITVALAGAVDRVAAALGQTAATALTTAAGHACAYLVTQSGSLQPLVQIGAPRSLPAMSWGWILYGDPSRAAELLARNAVGTPFFMPATFEALAPKRST